MTPSPARSAAIAALLLLACLPGLDRPNGDPDTPHSFVDLGAEDPPPWSDVTGADPSTGPSSTSTTTAATTSTASETGHASASTVADPEPRSLHDLRLSEVLADPDGKDGGPGSPEIVEIVNVGADPAPLEALTIRARTWPKLDGRALGLSGEELAPGERLLVRRFASAAEADALGVIRRGEVLQVTVTASSGLRNDDGAVLLEGPSGAILDAILYGGPQPAPYDASEAWIGEPVAAAGVGLSLCRAAPMSDSDSADDWIPCVPSPGEVGDDAIDPIDPIDTTGGEGDPPGASLVIVEVLSNAPGPSAGEKLLEYVEILNISDEVVDLTAVTIADDLDLEAPGRDPLLYREGDSGCGPTTCLSPGARALIVGNLYEGPTGGALVLETDDTTLADGGLSAAEAVVLRNADDVVISTYRAWPDPLAEPYPVAIESPLQRLTVDAADAPASWIYVDPSPGLP